MTPAFGALTPRIREKPAETGDVILAISPKMCNDNKLR